MTIPWRISGETLVCFCFVFHLLGQYFVLQKQFVKHITSLKKITLSLTLIHSGRLHFLGAYSMPGRALAF